MLASILWLFISVGVRWVLKKSNEMQVFIAKFPMGCK
jgi:hypothetical protein